MAINQNTVWEITPDRSLRGRSRYYWLLIKSFFLNLRLKKKGNGWYEIIEIRDGEAK